LKEGTLNTNASTMRETCTFLYPVTQITKTSQQQVKNKEKWMRVELTEPRCRALRKSHVATLAEVRHTQVCLVRSDLKQSYSKNDYTQKKDKIQKKFHQ
jgi:hypothetical protein